MKELGDLKTTGKTRTLENEAVKKALNFCLAN